MLVLPPRSQLLRDSAVALIPVVLSLWVTYQTFYPTADISELGWWAAPVGQVSMSLAGVIAFPALPVFLLIAFPLTELGVPEVGALLLGAILAALFGAVFWGWLIATLTNWVRARREV